MRRTRRLDLTFARATIQQRKSWLVFLVALGAASTASAETPSSPDALPPGEVALEGRLLAPCCWTQTLDVHESELAADLRAEIHTRLIRGERSDSVEDDLVSRYGERLRAVPKGSDSRKAVPLMVAIGMTLSSAALFGMLRRWRRNGRIAEESSAPTTRDAYDERLDDELRVLDD